MLMQHSPAMMRSLFLINDRLNGEYSKKIMRKYIQWFADAVRQHWRPMAVMMTCHLFLAVCAVAFVYICKELVDIAVAVFKGMADREGLFFWAGMMAVVIILRILLNALRTYLQTRTEIKVKNSLRRRLFDVLLRMDAEGSKKYHSGDILSRIQEDVRVLSSTTAVYLPNLFGTALQLVAALAFLLYLDLRLAVLIVVIVPVGLLIGRFITGRIRNLTLDIRKRDSKVQSHLQESIQHLTLLQTLEYGESSSDELNDLQGELYYSEIRRTKFSVVSRIFVALAFQAGYATAFMWGVLGISAGAVTYGMMTAFLQLVGQIQRPLLDMSSMLPSIIHSTASIDRVMEIESLPQESLEESVLMSGTAGVSLENVTFAYPDSQIPVLSDFSYDFVPGSRTAIVGPTGVGKTTLIRLLLALLKPQRGDIHIYTAPSGAEGNCVNASAATRCNLVYVPQGKTLFSGTIRDNLLMGNPEATEQQLRDALHTAAADFVFDLPEDVDSQCFEAGAGLSEGQAQRIAIARALLRPGSILLMDEFSSALDAETEVLLMERLTRNLPDHTMIFITHREKIIDYCTDVLRL